jgi:curved DNA-binding protein CbpA
MEASAFINYYEVLEISPNADAETLGRIYHHLARRYHPDNPETGDRDRFDLVVEANAVLKDPARRAQYDTQYEQHVGTRQKSAGRSGNGGDIERDVEIQEKLLSIFYNKRRRNVAEPGVPEFELESAFDCPIEQLEFHLWYLKEKGWITRADSGQLAITVEGIDQINSEHHRKTTVKLLVDRNRGGSFPG